ncbi:MAG: AraC family transcriptional regulator [Gordonia sp. (in: high G+C Gram-positive bacteria)]
MTDTEFCRSSELPHLEARRSCRENSCYRPHTHDAFSLGLIDSGHARLSGPLDDPVDLDPGDVIVIPAYQVHACNPRRERWEYQMMHLDQDWLAAIHDTEPRLSMFDRIRVVRDPAASRAVAELCDDVFADLSADRLAASIREVLSTLALADAAHVVGGAPDRIDRFRPVLDRLRDDEANPSLDDLGALVRMDRFQLVREFKRATGLAPLAWRQNVRVQQARRLLRDGRSIAETAHHLGFADQSHFHRVFRAHVAAAPGMYRDGVQERSRPTAG